MKHTYLYFLKGWCAKSKSENINIIIVMGFFPHKQCHLKARNEMKATFMCKKCDARLHVNCFKEGFIVMLVGFDPKIKNAFGLASY